MKNSLLVLFIISLITGCQFNENTHFNIAIDDASFSKRLSEIDQINPDEAMELMYDSSLALFIDVRKPHDFEKGHLENAINIPVPDLLDPEYKSIYDQTLNDSIPLVVYGKDELEANAPWMLLYELGYTNARSLQGGYSYIDRMYTGDLKEGESYNSEAAVYDFAKVIEDAKLNKASPVKKEEVKKKVVVKAKVKKPAEGGC